MEFSDLLERFISYIKIDTQSKEDSESYPSTKKQLDLSKKLKDDLEAIGLDEVVITDWGYVIATLKTNQQKQVPTIALLAHLDTSPDVSGKDVNHKIHKNYNGQDIVLSADGKIVLKIDENPYLREKIGKTIITTDGKTLLGADDKAGIAEIISAVNYLINHPQIPRPNIRLVFTPDEEVARGTEHITVDEIDADYGYTVDGEKLGEVEDETFCADTVKIDIKGVNVHPGYAKDKMVNAIKIAAQVIEQFPKKELSPETTEKDEGYIHPHHLTGSEENAKINILVRDFTEEGLVSKENYLKEVAQKVAAQHPKATIDVEVIKSYRNMKIILDKHPKVMEKAIEAIKMSTIKPIHSSIRGGTDGARLSFMGLPCPNLFTGGSNFHSKYEWIALEDMQKSAEVIVNLMKLWAEE